VSNSGSRLGVRRKFSCGKRAGRWLGKKKEKGKEPVKHSDRRTVKAPLYGGGKKFWFEGGGKGFWFLGFSNPGNGGSKDP